MLLLDKYLKLMAMRKVMAGVRLVIAVVNVDEVKTKLSTNIFCANDPLNLKKKIIIIRVCNIFNALE